MILFRKWVSKCKQYWIKKNLSRKAIIKGDIVVSSNSKIILMEGSNRSDITIDKNVMMHGKLYSENGGTIYIGKNTSIRKESMIWCVNKIDIGNYVVISDGVVITDNNNHPVSPAERLKMIDSGWSTDAWRWKHSKSKNVLICDNVWIGKDAKILKGVTIGKNSIVAMGAVVVKNVPENCIVAGNPAKIVKHIN